MRIAIRSQLNKRSLATASDHCALENRRVRSTLTIAGSRVVYESCSMVVRPVETIAPTESLRSKGRMQYARTAAFDISSSNHHYLFSPAQAALVSQLCVWNLRLK